MLSVGVGLLKSSRSRLPSGSPEFGSSAMKRYETPIDEGDWNVGLPTGGVHHGSRRISPAACARSRPCSMSTVVAYESPSQSTGVNRICASMLERWLGAESSREM